MTAKDPYFRILRVVEWILSRVNIEAQGKENVPREGPLIVAFNHTLRPIHIEGLALGITLPRKLTGMILKEAYHRPELALPLRYLQWQGVKLIPVNRDRGSDHQAARQALEALENNEVLVIAPEAGLEKEEIKLGAAWLATKTGAPILPVAIWRTEEDSYSLAKDVRALFQRGKLNLYINIGEPFHLVPPETRNKKERRESLVRGAEEIMQRIALLLPEERR